MYMIVMEKHFLKVVIRHSPSRIIKSRWRINPANPYALAELEKLGVQWEEPVVKVSEEILEAYTGTYELTKGMKITVTREGNLLYGQGSRKPQGRTVSKIPEGILC